MKKGHAQPHGSNFGLFFTEMRVKLPSGGPEVGGHDSAPLLHMPRDTDISMGHTLRYEFGHDGSCHAVPVVQIYNM